MITRDSTHVAYGYTMGDLYDIAVYAVRTDFVRPGIEWDERVAAAWSAVATELFLCENPPQRNQLVMAGRAASSDVIDQNMRHHGRDKRASKLGETRVNFERFWTHLPGASIDDRVVDRVSLAQIWPRLDEPHRHALFALAIHGDYAVAAEWLGLRYYTFCARVRSGRIAFLRLWHEGESPSSVWGSDRRKGRDNTGRTAVRVHARSASLRKKAEQREAVTR